jgi:hypothetical protein
MSAETITAKSIRWLNVGSCIVRSLFNKKSLQTITIGSESVPVDVVSAYRRNMAAMRSDWEAEVPSTLDADDRQFLDFWLVPRPQLAEMDIIWADLPIDVLYSKSPRLRRDDRDVPAAAFDQLVTNFPFSPGHSLGSRLGMFASDEREWLDAWRWFGDTVRKPTIFLLIEEREDLPEGYTGAIRQRLLHYQSRIEELSTEFAHWRCVHVDRLLSDRALDCYVDRHHLTPAGYDLLRERLLSWLGAEGIADALDGGMPIRHRSWLVPERCDFVELPQTYVESVAALYRKPVVIGAPQVTRRVSAQLSSCGAAALAAATGASAPNDASVDGVIYAQWAQFTRDDARLSQIRKKYPDALIEVPSQWSEQSLLEGDELELRSAIRTRIVPRLLPSLQSHTDDRFRRYAVRVLLPQITKWWNADVKELRELDATPADVSRDEPDPIVSDLHARWTQTATSPLFCSPPRT